MVSKSTPGSEAVQVQRGHGTNVRPDINASDTKDAHQPHVERLQAFRGHDDRHQGRISDGCST